MDLITKERILKSRYDVIVIGAGLGGLAAASLLAKRGVDVLLVEQHCLPGGACTSFKREDRTFDSGAALIFGFGKEGYHLHRNLMNMLEEPITVIPRDKFFRLDFAGQRIDFWKDLRKFLAELQKHFPDESDELQAFYDHITTYYERNIKGQDLLTPPTELSSAQKVKMLKSSPARIFSLLKLMTQSAADLIRPFIKSKKLIEFYDKLCASYAYINMNETPAIMAMTMFTDNHVGGTYYVAGSAQTYSNALERSIERNGGTVLYRERVEEIRFDRKVATGVRLASGSIIHGNSVVSDTTVWNLYSRLIPPGLVSAKQRKWVESLVPTYPAMVLYIAARKEVFPSDTNAVEYFISNTADIDMGDITMYIPTVDDHSLGPEDEHILTIFSPSPDQEWPRPDEPGYQSEQYKQKKERQAELIINEIEKRFPGFRSGIVRLYIATPSTIERYTLKNGGCVGGPKQMIGQHLTKRLHARTSWKGLYACGDSTTMGMGMPAVIASGFGAANVILRDKGMEEYHYTTPDKEFVSYIKAFNKPVIPRSIDGNPENARLIAKECQHCEHPPCVAACPARVDIPGFIRRIESGNFEGAARIVRETNPLAEICGTICSPDKFCQQACVRNAFDGKPVRVQELHGWVARHASAGGWNKARPASNGMQVGVVGSDITGLIAAHFLARLGYTVKMYNTRESFSDAFHHHAGAEKLPRDVIERELEGLVLSSVVFMGQVSCDDQASLRELAGSHAALLLTTKCNGTITENNMLEGFSNIFIQNAQRQDGKREIVHHARDGRDTAMAIHEFLSRS